MTDDVCGADCIDDSPCQHPAGSCPVPSHSNPDAENPAGRPSKFNDDRREDILKAAREGVSQSGCARAAGIDESTLRYWLDERPDFSRAFARARAEGEQRIVRGGLTDELDTSMAKFLLSTSFDYYERREIEHDGELDLSDVTVDFANSDT